MMWNLSNKLDMRTGEGTTPQSIQMVRALDMAATLDYYSLFKKKRGYGLDWERVKLDTSDRNVYSTRSSSSSVASPTFDNLLLQYLILHPHFRPPNQHPLPPFAAANSLEDLLVSDLLLNLIDFDSDSENNFSFSKTQLAREESKLEKEIVRTILSGEVEKSKPNSGQTVSIGDHHVCVGFQEEAGSGYRSWEWRRHIMLFDEEDGYTREYIYTVRGKGHIKQTEDFGYFHDPLTIVAEIFELTSSLRVVEVMRKAGDMSEYVDFCNGELRSGLLRFLFVFYLQVFVVAGLCSFLH
ncbi:hypothetical protein STAS_33793 [Striga asiatica]|uniref:Uncharacterized protein n=1 Tax=Striga asiatica TaxID=4170 RepID=A0A5A7RFY6_STRAF|nr:hypothetical protein STAS_33793 [Striga asiatica]